MNTNIPGNIIYIYYIFFQIYKIYEASVKVTTEIKIESGQFTSTTAK